MKSIYLKLFIKILLRVMALMKPYKLKYEICYSFFAYERNKLFAFPLAF